MSERQRLSFEHANPGCNKVVGVVVVVMVEVVIPSVAVVVAVVVGVVVVGMVVVVLVVVGMVVVVLIVLVVQSPISSRMAHCSNTWLFEVHHLVLSLFAQKPPSL